MPHVTKENAASEKGAHANKRDDAVMPLCYCAKVFADDMNVVG
jgi:hypothetical protein